MNKKGGGEINFIIFYFVFIAVMGIIASIFLRATIEKEKVNDPDNAFIGIVDTIATAVGKIPYVGTFLSYAVASASFIFVNQHLAAVFLALIGPPMGYILLRLIRGGG